MNTPGQNSWENCQAHVSNMTWLGNDQATMFLSFPPQKQCWIIMYVTWSFLFIRDQHCPGWGWRRVDPIILYLVLLQARYHEEGQILSRLFVQDCSLQTFNCSNLKVTKYITQMNSANWEFQLAGRPVGYIHVLLRSVSTFTWGA